MVTLDEAGRGAAGARLSRPAGGGARFVEHAFILDFRGLSRTGWKVLPDTAGHLLIHLAQHDGRLVAGAPSLVGARSRAIETDVSKRSWTVGVRLRPGALPALTGLPAADFTDRGTRASDAWARAGDLDDRFGEAADRGGAAAVRSALLDFVAERARSAPDVPWVARALDRRLAAEGGPERVGMLAEGLGVAPRTLRARSHAELGLSPKRFARIRRLFRALELSREATRWSDVAVRAGFSDQPHLVRDFRALLGETPATFAARAAS